MLENYFFGILTTHLNLIYDYQKRVVSGDRDAIKELEQLNQAFACFCEGLDCLSNTSILDFESDQYPIYVQRLQLMASEEEQGASQQNSLEENHELK